MDLCAALPNLATLLWRQSTFTPAQPRTQHMFSDFIGSKAAERLPGSGLRLLEAEHCSFTWVPNLPASLQLLSLKNLGRGHSVRNGQREFHPINKYVSCLLHHCVALRELYLLHCKCELANPDLPSIAASCPVLRVLVLHVVAENGQEVSPFLHNGMGWPITGVWT